MKPSTSLASRLDATIFRRNCVAASNNAWSSQGPSSSELRCCCATSRPTTDALAARTGICVVIERWGGPATLGGRVRSVEPATFTKVSALGVEEQRVRVLIDITSPQPEWQALGDGYRVSVRIVTLAEAKAVQVPVSAVFPLPAVAGADAADAAKPSSAANAAGAGNNNGSAAAAARFAVFVADNGRARRVPVLLGGRNGNEAWIRSGVTPGQQVIVYPPATVKDGLWVAARKP